MRAANVRSVRWYAKLRSGSNSLEVDLGRQTHPITPRHDRLCTICRLREVGDEEHFAVRCPALAEERGVLFQQLRQGLEEAGFGTIWRTLDQMHDTDKTNVLLGASPNWPKRALAIITNTARLGLYSMFQRRKKELYPN